MQTLSRRPVHTQRAQTVCGSPPGPHCVGCYAHAKCGSNDNAPIEQEDE